MASATSLPPSPAPPSARGVPAAPAAALRERGPVVHDTVRADTWSSHGVTKVTGVVEVGRAELEGAVVVGDRLTAEHLSVRGSLEVVGPLSVRSELSLHGAMRAGRGLEAGEAALAGTVQATGPVKVAGRLVSRGSLSVPSVEARESDLAGLLRVPGEIRSQTVELELADRSEVGAVLARSVSVRGPDGGLLDKLLGRSRRAHLERIEAETVTLEHVDVGSVSAREVVLGRDCHVERLEAVKVRTHPSSRIGPESRSPPPPGLRR